jgi:hypothetical protein
MARNTYKTNQRQRRNSLQEQFEGEKLRQEMRAKRYESKDVPLKVLRQENDAKREERRRLRIEKEKEIKRAMQHFFYNL